MYIDTMIMSIKYDTMIVSIQYGSVRKMNQALTNNFHSLYWKMWVFTNNTKYR